MALTFPNRSRSYDENGHRIRFFGYDGMFEVRFFLELDALAKAFTKKISGENDCLAAFDAMRKLILETAEKVYGQRKGANMHVLTSSDFR
jgi:hypothetical protein